MPRFQHKVVVWCFCIFCSALAFGQQAVRDRIVRPIDNHSLVQLKGTVHPRARSEFDQGPVSPALPLERMTLVFQPTADQHAALDQLLAEQQDRFSPNYHKWLTPEEYADQFGVSQHDLDLAAAWLRSQGFTVNQSARGRTWIAFSGSAAQVEAAFHTQIHNYLQNGKLHYAAASDPSIPTAFAGVISGVGALNNFAPHPLNLKAKPRVTSSITGNHFIAPGDFATLYDLQTLYSDGVNGTGQAIAVMGQTDLSTDSNPGRNGTPGAVVNGQQQQYDLVTFRNLAGLPALNSSNFQALIVPGTTDPGVVTADVDEANLDVEWAGAVAPNATLIYVIENSNSGGAFSALQYAVDQNLAPILSLSYGLCEPQVDSTTRTNLTAAGQQANAQGQTIVTASGDSGAADCDSSAPATQGLAVDFPGSLPTITSMGGTTFSADSANSVTPTAATQYWSGSTNDTDPSALAYIPETSWNDSTSTTLSATGGGVSTFSTSKPSWQTGPGVPNDNARDLPDVSFSSSPNHDGTLICSQSSCVNGYRNTDTTFDVIGGTSAAVPTFAGVVALINQKLNSAQGNVNPALYTQAASAPWAFHDITTGNNIVTCTPGTTNCPSSGLMGYSAGVGYDQVTGLGSLDVGAFINALTGNADFSVTPSVTSLTLAATDTAALTFNVLGTAGSAISFTCTPSSSLTATTCSAPSVAANGATAVTSTLTVITAGANAAAGTLTVQATNGTTSHTVPIALNVGTPDFTLSAASSSLSLASGGSGTDTLTVASVSGFSSDVSLTCSVSSSLGATTCSVSPTTVSGGNGTATLTINAATLALDRGAPLHFLPGGGGMYGSLAFAFGVVFTLNPPRRRKGKRHALRNVLGGLVVVVALLPVVSCGGGSNSGSGTVTPPTPLSGTVTVQATGGGMSHSTTVSVTIN